MGQAISSVRYEARRAARVMSITWPEFVESICDLNAKCGKLVDIHGQYLIFAVKRGTADNVFWKATIRICVLKKSEHSTPDSCRIITLGQFLTLEKSLLVILDGLITGQNNSFDSTSCLKSAYPDDGECIICMERKTDTILSCTHAYCLPCIEQWKALGKNFCPLCREGLQSDGWYSWVVPEQPEGDLLREYLTTLAVPPENL
uniref:RING finger protein 141 n=1 Tax=Syphacia muris TaxID=451379 RepID=A0A0N5AX94_9BILA